MRFSASDFANVVAWGVLVILALLAIGLVAVLGPLGLLLLGLATLLVCTLFSLSEEAPTWGTEVFRARMDRPMAPEQRAALAEERRAALSPLRFYRWCGVVLAVAGRGWRRGPRLAIMAMNGKGPGSSASRAFPHPAGCDDQRE